MIGNELEAQSEPTAETGLERNPDLMRSLLCQALCALPAGGEALRRVTYKKQQEAMQRKRGTLSASYSKATFRQRREKSSLAKGTELLCVEGKVFSVLMALSLAW